jgi:trk system potassium uptake protein TrkH
VNHRLIINQLGIVLIVLSVCMVGSDAAAWLMLLLESGPGHEDEGRARWALVIGASIGLIIGGLAWRLTRGAKIDLGRRDALLLTAATWLIGSAMAAAPFFVWAHISATAPDNHPFRSFIDCYFESVSGLTTTGSTVLSSPPNDVQSLPGSLLLWRAMTHWLGGIGIVVLFVAVLPGLGVGGKKLYRAESSGLDLEGVRPQIRDTARLLWFTYVIFTAVQIIALCAAGMSLFDSVCQTFSTLATGGFSTANSSIGQFDSVAIDLITVVFMVLGGVNFGLYYMLVRRKFSTVFRDVELRVYLAMMVGGTLIAAGALYFRGTPIALTTGAESAPTVAQSLRYAWFDVVSVQTTTGFNVTDTDQWPLVAKMAFFALMFAGGCAGSTAGGFKIIRLWIVLKVIATEIERVFRPQVIRPLRVGRTTLEDQQKLANITFVFAYVLIFAIGGVAVMLLEQVFNAEGACDFATASSASIASLSNVGPGLGRVGAVGNYGWLSEPSKFVLSLLMVVGRLELFAILVLFTPRFWKRN